jgi:hypothetical protein
VEFLQAAATQVVFFESAAMFGSIETRLEFQQRKKSKTNSTGKSASVRCSASLGFLSDGNSQNAHATIELSRLTI